MKREVPRTEVCGTFLPEAGMKHGCMGMVIKTVAAIKDLSIHRKGVSFSCDFRYNFRYIFIVLDRYLPKR